MGSAQFSIIVPVYNGEKYLREALDSVVSQTYADWEMILIDDGSSDGSLGICSEYAARDRRIQCIHQENQGVAITRRNGVEKASGEYIVFLDCDDWLDLDCLEKLDEAIRKETPDILLFGHIDEMTDGTSRPWIWDREGLYDRNRIEKEIFPYLIHDEHARYFPYNLCGNAVKRELLSGNMIADSRATIGEDGACMIPTTYRAQSMLFMKPCFYHYRYNPQSASRSRKVIHLDNARMIAEHLAARVNLDMFGFQAQWYRKIVHDVFLICVSRFNAGKGYFATGREIRKELEREPYREAACKARFALSGAAAVRLILRWRWVLPIYLYYRKKA